MIWRTALAAASYGCTIGAVHSLRFAMRNIVKFPLLIFVTAGVCSLCYYILARSFTRTLEARAVATSALTIYHDTAIFLASLSPVSLFLALTIERPDQNDLHEYPLFLSVNVCFVAVGGTLALVRQCKRLLVAHGLPMRQGALLIATWLAASLLVGAQASWYMRPFCGVSTVDAPFMLGSQPDWRGATSFYEAIYQIFVPPPAGGA